MTLHNALTAAALSLIALGAFAQDTTSTPRIDARQARQEMRIEKGVATGALTPSEAKRLEARETRIARLEDRAKADGKVTPAEKAHLVRAENKASRAIKRQKHDAQITAPAVK